MPTLQILTFTLPTPSTTAEAQSQTALCALQTTAKAPANFVLGARTPDPSALQLTAEWRDPGAASTPEAAKYRDAILSTLGNPQKMFHVSLSGASSTSAFSPAGGSDAPLASPLVEYVQVFFPSGRVDGAFQEKIEADFARFDELCMRVVRGNGGLRYGWVVGEQQHAGVEGGKSRCFFVARGWEGMQFFDDVVQTAEYAEAVKILLAWGAPWELWHVKRAV